MIFIDTHGYHKIKTLFYINNKKGVENDRKISGYDEGND